MNLLRSVPFRRSAIALLLGLASVFSTILPAQTLATGIITGTVANAGTGQFLRSAEVRIKGTNFIALSEGDGSFYLNNVPAGTHRITVTRTRDSIHRRAK